MCVLNYLFIWLPQVCIRIFSCSIEFLVVHVGSSSLIRDRNPVPCIGNTSLSHWTTREVPGHGHFDCIGSDSHWSWLLKDASEQIQESKISGSHLDKFQNEKDIWSGSLSPSCSRSKEFLQLRCLNRNLVSSLRVKMWVIS